MKNDIPGAIHNAFLELDHDMRHCWDNEPLATGSTGIMVLIKEGKLFCGKEYFIWVIWLHFIGSAGDSRAVLSEKGQAIPLSFDHKPNDPDELKRIYAAGGWVRIIFILFVSK